ncbi:DUF5753 domain-containing protein [Saccharothrix sp. S26]|nr:DUF5753 domain-containing protein [Saccharothrix sp. S26]
MTIEDAAAALDKHRNSLYRLEAGETRLDVHLARSMMDVYDHYDPDLIDQVREALKPGWWTAFGLRDMGYVDLETEASTVWELALILLPGLLQTESYARAVLETGSLKRTKPELVNQVKVRMIRQQRLTSEANALRLVALVDESALWQRIGGEAVMRDQLNHLVMVAELDTVTLRVLPRDLGFHAGQDGAFTLLDFSDAEDPSMLYVPHATGSLHIEDPEQVRRARMLVDHLLERALGSEDSIALIERILAERE